MEVHHHPDLHHKPKAWKEYFLEFLMIFLAVTLGFFAESIRENIKEHSTAKELATSLYSDLKQDTATINHIAAFRSEKEKKMDSLFTLLGQHPKEINAARFFQLIIPAFSTDDFSEKRSTGTITQLNNAGYLRFYTYTNIPRALSQYESSANSLFAMEKMESTETVDKGIAFLSEQIDPALFNAAYSNKSIPGDVVITSSSPDGFRSLYGICVAIEILNSNTNHHYLTDTKQKAVALMTILKKRYRLGDE